MNLVKDLHYFEKSDEVDLCRRCMRVFKGKIYLTILKDETKAVLEVSSPTFQKPFFCKECWNKMDEKEKARWLRAVHMLVWILDGLDTIRAESGETQKLTELYESIEAFLDEHSGDSWREGR